jgi:cytidylate kinase
MRITLGGLPGSGTTTVAHSLCRRLNLDLISAGMIFRAKAEEMGISIEELSVLCEKDPKIDEFIDKTQKKIVMETEDVLVESRLSGFIIDAELKMWLKAPLEIRSRRVASRERMKLKDAIEEISKREESEMRRYRRYYHIDLEDTSVYDLVIDSSRFDAESIVKIIMAAVDI